MKDGLNFALIGSPLAHSISPFIHSELFGLKGINGNYSLIEVTKEELEKVYDNKLKALCGFNVTIPHKINIIPLLDSLEEKAALYSSVNTVKINETGAVGHNTDCEGFLRSLETADITLGGSVLILGCGGVARMFAFEALLKGANVTLAVRKASLEKAERLRGEINSKLNKDIFITDIDGVGGGYDLIINATPVGMSPNTGVSPVKRDVVKASGAVFDAIYNPGETELLRYAREEGIKHLNGLPMLVIQAAAAQEIWLDTSFGFDELQGVISLCDEELKRR